MNREIKQIIMQRTQVGDNIVDAIWVLATDGSLWRFGEATNQWVKAPRLPTHAEQPNE